MPASPSESNLAFQNAGLYEVNADASGSGISEINHLPPPPTEFRRDVGGKLRTPPANRQTDAILANRINL